MARKLARSTALSGILATAALATVLAGPTATAAPTGWKAHSAYTAEWRCINAGQELVREGAYRDWDCRPDRYWWLFVLS
ncbi:hypothetical protein [Yinghuangia soli]|uniref:Secreted protein n=1 Tax=Yinghuangia soli TaxID=2908204 RepID=A0AA41Q961_9ACTN|nr:hypothetical protein [Yinghuangia soli]MCF2533531.1 hypothetical protein [Yinghuangia soli]